MTAHDRDGDDEIERSALVAADPHAGLELVSFVHRRRRAASVLLFMPAMGAAGTSYAGFATELARRGCDVVIASLRNARPVRRDRGAPRHARDFGYHDLLETDVAAALASVQARWPDRTLFVGGHSLGGQLALLYAARHPHAVAGVVLVAACSVYYRAWSGRDRLRVLATTQAFWLISECLGYFPGKRFGFAGVREARGVMRDWARQARTGRYQLRRDHDDEARLAACALPVLATSFADDDLAPPSAVAHLCGKLTAAALSRVVLPSDGARKGRPHFRWLRTPAAVAHTVGPWLEQQMPTSPLDPVA